MLPLPPVQPSSAPPSPTKRTPARPAELRATLTEAVPEDDSHTPKITRTRPHVRSTRAHPFVNPAKPRKAPACRVPSWTLPRQTVIPSVHGYPAWFGGVSARPIRVWTAESKLFRVPEVIERCHDDDAWKRACHAAGIVRQKMGSCMLGEHGTLHVMVATSNPMAKAIRDSCATSLKGEDACTFNPTR